MDRTTVATILVAIIAALAVGLAAATLTDPVDRNGVGGAGAGNDSAEGGWAPPEGEEATSDLDVRIPFVRELLMLAAAALAGVALLYLLIYRREAAKLVLMAALLVLVVYLLMRFLAPPELTSVGDGAGDAFGVGEDAGIDEDDPSPRTLPSILLFFVLSMAVVGTLLALVAGSRDAAESVADEPETSESPDLSSIGRAAGRAADRIEASTSPDNEVYRAWEEMVEPLEVARPEATTPGEFADAAVEAGIDPEDAAELTRLFEEVRYGGRPPSGTRERRAVETLRRIEATYAGGEGDG